ncbi:PP2C family protein-serine/threonine phosphatase [Natronohydrobacter thiooxidans]|uniref:PP2C family protein-serine/threonine phosphatase n=1 Tax=Natronohydrobacter thiooxidans TaxID=87172 RepID=UPI000ACCCA0B|nr:PP2C family protein-serine/threonine phosphatase [Natronohydrobacter thiooxidans]
MLTIRGMLATLFAIFGLTLLTLLWFQGTQTWHYFLRSSEQIIVDRARHDLLNAILGLQNDRARIIQISEGAPANGPMGYPLRSSAEALRRAADTLSGTGTAELQELGASIARQTALLELQAEIFATVQAAGDADALWAQSFVALEQLDLMQEHLQDLRRALLNMTGVVDGQFAGLQMLRNYLVGISTNLQGNRVRILRELNESQFSPLLSLDQIEDQTRRLEAAATIYLDALMMVHEDLMQPARSFSDFLVQVYIPAEIQLVQGIATGQDIPAREQDWFAATDEATRQIATLLNSVFEQSQSNLAAEQARNRVTLIQLLVLSVAVLALFIFSLFVIVRQIVSPLDELRRKMLELADGNLAPVGLKQYWLQDLRAMRDALRVFRVTGLRRERLTRERLELHAQIAEAHRSLKADLEAAAKVQLSQLPAPGIIGDIRFSSCFASANVIAGDTFDYIALGEGQVGLFQIDVAGHGAAAGLVSVAAHIRARRALSKLRAGVALADLVANLNRQWSADFTYFTLLIAAFDTATDTGRMVQAGHPSPVLIRHDGTIRRLGEGGLPIGVLPDAVFDEINFPFARGDRLVVFSDGMYENVTASGEIYGEDRFIEFLNRNAACSTEALLHKLVQMLDQWKEAGYLSDDVSLVVAERM